ncbi:hypothetical protein KP509_34G063300 [Ceratopteris richardii]|uniref:CASP-like protein n=1 Tax=Ceratopteris richardii TaxID=49495 RepID=A0A8T2QL19_CERRI|nr:hypothetical protein KP509_34G063300 [Ceratopteris richardii]
MNFGSMGLRIVLQVAIGNVSMMARTSPCSSSEFHVLFGDFSITAYILLSGVSAASEVLYLADEGMPKAQWEAMCETYGYFCHMVTASIVLGFLAVILMAVLSARNLFHNFYRKSVYLSKMRHSTLT